MKDFGLAFTSLFVALDVIGVLPMYVTLTKSMGTVELKKTANKSMLVAFLVALIFIFAGRTVFQHLGIAIYDFKMAGGLILLLISLADLIGGHSNANQMSGSTGIVPLAVPLITGPTVLTTLIIHVSTFGYVVTVLSLILNYAIAWVTLRKGRSVTDFIGNDGTVVISKIAALLLTAISVSMIRSGIFEAIAQSKLLTP